MTSTIDNLRKDFADTRSMMLHPDIQEWTPAEASELGANIAAVIAANELGELAFWSDWFALRGNAARALKMVGVAVVANLRKSA
jgi:hypothetical protein